MLKEERQKRILELLEESKSLKSTDLGEIFDVSQETIRKDLEYLDESGLLKRTFGGALAIKGENGSGGLDIIDPSLEDRNILHKLEKANIGKFAASLIEPRDTIVLDSSSTTLQLAKHIPDNLDIVVITNSLYTLWELAKNKGVTMISVGGYYRSKSTSFLGSMTLKNLEGFNINKAFLSGKAVSVDRGLMDPIEQEAEFKRKMIDMAQQSILLADSSKFKQIAPITTCPIKVFDTIVSDTGLADYEVDKIEKINSIKIYRV